MAFRTRSSSSDQKFFCFVIASIRWSWNNQKQIFDALHLKANVTLGVVYHVLRLNLNSCRLGNENKKTLHLLNLKRLNLSKSFLNWSKLIFSRVMISFTKRSSFRH
jgi:hypothetical protein